ncbi:MAG: SpoIIE family protein phosphatase [Candidatus Riflebacteria bacterium]
MANQKELGIQSGRSVASQLDLIRRWNLSHGRVYAPITEKHQPSPFLKDPTRDVITNDGVRLTKVTSAIMIRQISEISSINSGLKFRSNSLKPMNPANIASGWEAEAIKLFVSGKKEYSNFVKNASDSFELHYMVPSVALQDCVKCHSVNGFREGDILGGFSMILPVKIDDINVNLWITHIVALCMGLIVILYFSDRLKISTEKILLSQRQLEESNQKLQLINKEMKDDLVVAENLQKELFTNYSNPLFLELCTIYRPYSHVSGDVFTINQKPDQTITIFIGDGTGHGIAAAFTTIMAKVGLDQKSEEQFSVKLLEHLNELFEKYLPDERYMSAIYSRISCEGLLNVVNAGHPYLILITADGNLITLKESGLLLGLMGNELLGLKQENVQLKVGDRGFFITDGLIEQRNQQNESFGFSGLEKSLMKNRMLKLDAQINALMQDLESFASGCPADDDVTIVGFEYKGSDFCQK